MILIQRICRLLRLPLLACAGLLLVAAAAQAQEKEPFTEARFAALQKQDALVLIDVHATWCPTCAKQGEVLAAYQQAHPDVDLTILNVDFDDQKEWVTHFKAPRQSTLILYRGDERLWFSVAETDRERIFETINKAAGQ